MLPLGKNRGQERIGVSIGDDGVAVARIDRQAGSPRLTACVHAAGAGPAAVIGDLGLGKRSLATAVMARSDYQLLLVEAPDVPLTELPAAVRWRIRDLIGFSVDDAVIDVFELPEQARRGQARMLYAVAAPREAVQGQVDSLGVCGISLEAIDIPELCQRNIAALLPQDGAGVALLMLYADHAILTLTHSGVLYLARHIETGLEQLDSADGDSLVEALAGGIALEVQRSLDYYESHYNQPPIGDLVMAPGGRRLGELPQRVGEQLAIRVCELDLATMLAPAEPLTPTAEARCFSAIGAALRTAAVAP